MKFSIPLLIGIVNWIIVFLDLETTDIFLDYLAFSFLAPITAIVIATSIKKEAKKSSSKKLIFLGYLINGFYLALYLLFFILFNGVLFM
jgi:hypothetical protein